MADLNKGFKGIWMKGMEAIGDTASRIASNTKYKVNEMNLVNRRREILSDFGAKAYELWQKGERFPEELEALLKELSDLDTELNGIRMEKLASIQPQKPESEEAAQEERTPDLLDDMAKEAGKAASAVGTAFDNALDAIRKAVRGDKPATGEEGEEAPQDAPAEEAPVEADSAAQTDADQVPVIEVPEEEEKPREPTQEA